jgi:O-antigen/teichoic acid export membrane protein
MVITPITLLVAPLNRVLYGAFARIRHEAGEMARIWLNATALLGAIVVPLNLWLLTMAPDIIPFVFGDQWIPAVAVIQILSFFALFRALQAWNTAVIDAVGKPHISMLLTGAMLLLLPFSLTAGSRHGLEGVAAAYVVTVLLIVEAPAFVITSRELSVRARDVLKPLGGVFAAAVVMSGLVLLTRLGLEQAGTAAGVRVVAGTLVGACVYLGCLRLVAPGLASQIAALVRTPRSVVLGSA